MRVVLVTSPARSSEPNTNIPIGILWLSSYLEQHGHEVVVVDGARLRERPEELAERIRAARPQLVGIGGIITAYAYILKLVKAVKGLLPDVPVVLGGQVVINNLTNCFRHAPIDYAISGYGEIPLLKLVRHLEGQWDKDAIPALSYRDGDSIVTVPGREYHKDINDLPLPAYHLVDMDYYITAPGESASMQAYQRLTGRGPKRWRWGQLMGTLGCTDKCTFCIHEQEFVGLKRFSLDYLRRHIRLLRDTYDVELLGIGEEMFITTLKALKPFNEMMMAEFPEIFWAASTRANHVTPDVVEELIRGNCFQVGWGFESGSQRMLDLMQKRIDAPQNVAAYRLVDRSALAGMPSFMVGNVGETDRSMRETIKAITAARVRIGAAFYAQPYPGGRTWDWALERGLITDTHQYLLDSSDKNASLLSINLTPYPDWVLRFWNRQVVAAFQRNALRRYWQDRRICQTPAERRAHLKRTAISVVRGLLPHKIPFFLHHALTRAYCGWHDLRARFRPTARDVQCRFEVDQKGAILPSGLLVARPQRHLGEPQLADVLAHGSVRTAVSGTLNPFLDGVHVRVVWGAEAKSQSIGE